MWQRLKFIHISKQAIFNWHCFVCSYDNATVNQASDKKQDDGSAGGAGRVYDIKIEDFDISFGKRSVLHRHGHLLLTLPPFPAESCCRLLILA